MTPATLAKSIATAALAISLAACTPHTLPANQLVALMPESTRAVLVIQSPKDDANGEHPLFDEAALSAHMGMAETLRLLGAFSASMPLVANNDEDWHAVGLSAAIPVSKGQLPDLKASKLIFATLSKKPIDAPDGDWARMTTAPETQQVSLIDDVPIYYTKDRPDMLDEHARPDGAFAALIDHRLIIVSPDRSSIEEAVHRAQSQRKSLPHALRAIAATIPDSVDGYLLSAHQTQPSGMRIAVFDHATNLAASAISICRAPGDGFTYRFAVTSNRREADFAHLETALHPLELPEKDIPNLASISRTGSGWSRALELRFDVQNVRAAMAGEGIMMGMSYTYQQVFADLPAMDFDKEDQPDPPP